MNDSKIVILGPWRNHDANTEWLVTRYDKYTRDEVTVTVDGEQVTYPLDSEFVSMFGQSEGKAQKLGKMFAESDFMLMMEVRETASGAIRVSGV